MNTTALKTFTPAVRRQLDLADFMKFVGIQRPEEFRIVTRAHFIAWRRSLEGRGLATPAIRRKLSALSSLFSHLCDANAVTHNPVLGVKRQKSETTQGKTPATATGRPGHCSTRRPSRSVNTYELGHSAVKFPPTPS